MATQTKPTKGKTAKAATKSSKLVTSLPGKTAISRLAGVRPSRTKAFFAACAAAVTGATFIYRLLRSGDDK
jgi:hypothetical protein